MDEAVTDEQTSGTHVDSTSVSSNGSQRGNNDIAGKISLGQDFDGTNDYVQTTSSILKTATGFTISLWFNADATDFARHLLWQGVGTQNGFGDASFSASTQEMHITLGELDALNSPIDPLPVVGRDEDEEKSWYDPEDRDADANELAIDSVLKEAHTSGDDFREQT